MKIQRKKSMMRNKQLYAIVLAVLASVFYAVSTPVSKILLSQTAPTMLAAFLYLGAGIGIGIICAAKKNERGSREKLNAADLPFTIGMIALDIIAPILLMNGMARTTAANASLLNNFEIVATAVIAFFIFREKISPGMWCALALITLSSLILSFEGSESFRFSEGSVMVLCAAACWGLENNCTRMISSKSTYEIVILKGLFSGTGALIIALVSGEKIPALPVIGIVLLLGFVSYGLSLFAYIRAQEIIGAAKTSAFYALAPFVGAALSFLILNERISFQYAAGIAVMMAGSAAAVIDTLKYRHSHLHSHVVYHFRNGVLTKEIVTHEHEHSHIGPGITHHHIHKAV
jgi:drug/metabolite transporter (DMT)-like permease